MRGKVVSFDERTWWGRVCYDLTTLDFHGTSYSGFQGHHPPYPGQEVDIVLNQNGKLLAIHGVPKGKWRLK